MRSIKFFHRKQEKESRRYTRRDIVKNILAVIGGLVLLYFFITEILMRLLALLTKAVGGIS
jgi:hypothetical protein